MKCIKIIAVAIIAASLTGCRDTPIQSLEEPEEVEMWECNYRHVRVQLSCMKIYDTEKYNTFYALAARIMEDDTMTWDELGEWNALHDKWDESHGTTRRHELIQFMQTNGGDS